MLLLNQCDNSIIPFPRLTRLADIVSFRHHCWGMLRVTAEKTAKVLDDLWVGARSSVPAHVQKPARPFCCQLLEKSNSHDFYYTFTRQLSTLSPLTTASCIILLQTWAQFYSLNECLTYSGSGPRPPLPFHHWPALWSPRTSCIWQFAHKNLVARQLPTICFEGQLSSV